MAKKKNTDAERLDWLEKAEGYAVVSDDAGHWAVVTSGMQTIPLKAPGDLATSFFIKKKDWKKTVRKAIDAAMKDDS